MNVDAPWPGMVREIHVRPGDAVAADQDLVTIESMKLLTPVVSPAAGRVAAVLVELDTYVEEGAPLLTLEESS